MNARALCCRTSRRKAMVLLSILLSFSACSNPGHGPGNSASGQNSQGPLTPSDLGSSDSQDANASAALQLPKAPAIVYRGRFDRITDPNVASMTWPGSEIQFGFSGTTLSVTLSCPDPSQYAGSPQPLFMSHAVDGGNVENVTLIPEKTSYVLARDLAPGQHVVRLTRLNEGQFGRIVFHGVATDGNLTYTPPSGNRRLEFIGDSGACGYGVLGTQPCRFSTISQSSDEAFPALVGRALLAESRNISYSGKGLIQNRDPINDPVKTLPILWQRTSPLDSPNLAWNFNDYQPQAVIALVSGNDVFASVPTQDMFNQKIGAFIKELRAKYPQALLLFGVSPMLRRNDPHKDQRTTAISSLQITLASANDPNVQYIDLPQDTGFNGANCGGNCFLDPSTAPNCLGRCIGCDAHMNKATHQLVAQSIIATLRAKLSGW